MDLNIVTISQFTDVINRNWSVHNKFKELGLASQLFITEDMPANTGDTRRYTEIDPETFAAVKEEGVDASKAEVYRGYEKDMVARRFAREIDITWEMRRYNKKPEIMAKITSLTHFCPQRMEIDLTHRLTFCTATSYTDMDGQTVATTVGDTLALVSASHTLNGSSTTFSNVITGNPIFSKGGLEVAELQGNTQIFSQFGERRIMDFNTIVTTDDPTVVNNVKQFLQSTTDVDQNNPGVINVYKGKYRHLALPYLATDAAGAYNSAKKDYWGLVAAGQGQMGWQAYLGIWERPMLKTPAPGNNGEDFHNDNWTYGTRCAYGIATVSPRGLLWSTGAGA
jgi:hypothetical protein|tara:strand:- start:3551 stop:4564 length:1014 start_codon:yes stop_codon:yes gene_type:complete